MGERRRRTVWPLFLLGLAGALGAGPTPAQAQADYTGLTTYAGPADTYVLTYVGPPAAGTPAVIRSPGTGGPGSLGGTVSVSDPAVHEGSALEAERAGALVTGWDLVAIAALGIAAVVAFAISASRFRST